MSPLPFHLVTLSHTEWDEALTCAKRLGEDALPELRLDLFPELDPEALVDALRRRCLVTCRRAGAGGGPGRGRGRRAWSAWSGAPGPARPGWTWSGTCRCPPDPGRPCTHVRLLRSSMCRPGCLRPGGAPSDPCPGGDAFKWVGWAGRLARQRPAPEAPGLGPGPRNMRLSAFLMGPKGLASRCLQAAWGGAFTYAAPDGGPPAAPGQLPLARLSGLALPQAPSRAMDSAASGRSGAAFPGARLPQPTLPAGLQGPALPAPGLRRMPTRRWTPWKPWPSWGRASRRP